MLSEGQIQILIAENEKLQAEVEELNEILAIKEEAIAELKKIAISNAEIRSKMDIQQEEIEILQSRIGQQKQKSAGAEQREFELHQELTAAAKEHHQYTDLLKQYTYANIQLNDVQEQVTALKKRNNMLQQIAVKIGEMESMVETLTAEKDALQNKISGLEKLQRR
jgi:chromosome segregation ATPase